MQRWHCIVNINGRVEVTRVHAESRSAAKLIAAERFGTVTRNVTSLVKIAG